MLSFIRCTEIYTPNINSTTEALVVQGLITDGTGPFTINLSKAILYTSNSVSASNYVLSAQLTVTDNQNNTFPLTETGNGNYTLPLSFKAVIGNSYILHIQTKDGNTYESNSQKLLQPLTYDSIHGMHNTEKYLGQDNQLRNVPGSDILVDLFKTVSTGDSVPLCRFNPVVTIQYQYTVTEKDTTNWHWEYNDWRSFQLNTNENITEDNSQTASAFIKNHSVGFVPIGMESYGMASPDKLTYYTYYLRIYQYTINRDSYNFYKGANSQLAASGTIFDPVTAQLYGNMKCVNNPAKIVLGLFEVSSLSQSAYVVIQSPYSTNVLLQKVPYVDIPSSGTTQFKVWNLEFVPMPKDPAYNSTMPSWWMHY